MEYVEDVVVVDVEGVEVRRRVPQVPHRHRLSPTRNFQRLGNFQRAQPAERECEASVALPGLTANERPPHQQERMGMLNLERAPAPNPH